MKLSRWFAAALVVTAAVAFLPTNSVADSAATYLPPSDAGPALSMMKLQADKRFGFAPLKLNLSGMLETKDGNLVRLNGGQNVRLTIESPFLHVQNGVRAYSVVSDVHYDVTSPGPQEPSIFKRVLEIRKPGNYVFRVYVINPDGTVLTSNEVTFTAL